MIRTVRTHTTFKKYALLIGLLLLFITLVYGLSYLKEKVRTRILMTTAETLCRASSTFQNIPITITEAADTVNLGLPFQNVLTATVGEKKALIFFLPLTGKYGVYTGVFLYEQSDGCIFCGLAGVRFNGQSAGQYGITQTIIELHRKKIEAIMNGKRGNA